MGATSPTFRLLFGALVGAQLAYPRVGPSRRPAATRGIVGLLLAASAADAVHACGRRRAAAQLAGAGTIGFAAELAGTATGRPFGHYAYSDGLGPRWRGVPLLAAGAWAMMARPSWAVARLLARRRTSRIAVAAGALTAWDVFLDPRMVRDGFWTWPGGGDYEDVPLSNFAGWLTTGVAIFAAWSALEADDAAPTDGALALYVWTWVGETVANAVLWRRPRVAAAGGVAMGAFAAPALRARLER